MDGDGEAFMRIRRIWWGGVVEWIAGQAFLTHGLADLVGGSCRMDFGVLTFCIKQKVVFSVLSLFQNRVKNKNHFSKIE
jgi:hypothetical protein